MKNSSSKIFISWSGKIEKELAHSFIHILLKNIFGSEFENRYWFSPDSIGSGKFFITEIEKALKDVNVGYGICMLTDYSVNRPWINFEAGYLKGKLDEVHILSFVEDYNSLVGPLKELQSISYNNKEKLIKILTEITQEKEISVENAVHNKFNEWTDSVSKILNKESTFRKSKVKISNTLDRISNSKKLSNTVLHQIVCKAIDDLDSALKEKEDRMEIIAEKYPLYLTHLQRIDDLSLKTKAIAIYNKIESFWNTRIGKNIQNSISPDSHRVFVFEDSQNFSNQSEELIEQAKKYNVYAISRKLLIQTTNYYNFIKDFSILSDSNSEVLAEYKDDTINKHRKIQFSVNQEEIKEHNKVFDKILNKAYKINKNADVDELEREMSKQFDNKLEVYVKRPAEMSEYIPIHLYDEHEEKHEYYVEMMDKMISYIDQSQEQIDILEFGAGTGIFTKRLAKIKNAKIVALEIDRTCFLWLEKNLSDYSNVEVIEGDSRTYDPSGKFDYIFSSFADHHIKEKDKPQYFRNVKINLNKDGCFIVGDEFLREYDPDNYEDFENALKEYHNHIIQKAKEKKHDELVELETKALESGLIKDGDFKISNIIYEEHLKKENFAFDQPVKIGPKEKDSNIGGIFVYKIWNKKKV